jgi:protein-tyrosine-phosphatase
MGEAVLRDVANKRGISNITVDSCGTAGYHVGEPPDDRYVDDNCLCERKLNFIPEQYRLAER